jgi:hypothetical protein
VQIRVIRVRAVETPRRRQIQRARLVEKRHAGGADFNEPDPLIGLLDRGRMNSSRRDGVDPG